MLPACRSQWAASLLSAALLAFLTVAPGMYPLGCGGDAVARGALFLSLWDIISRWAFVFVTVDVAHAISMDSFDDVTRTIRTSAGDALWISSLAAAGMAGMLLNPGVGSRLFGNLWLMTWAHLSTGAQYNALLRLGTLPLRTLATALFPAILVGLSGLEHAGGGGDGSGGGGGGVGVGGGGGGGSLGLKPHGGGRGDLIDSVVARRKQDRNHRHSSGTGGGSSRRNSRTLNIDDTAGGSSISNGPGAGLVSDAGDDDDDHHLLAAGRLNGCTWAAWGAAFSQLCFVGVVQLAVCILDQVRSKNEVLLVPLAELLASTIALIVSVRGIHTVFLSKVSYQGPGAGGRGSRACFPMPVASWLLPRRPGDDGGGAGGGLHDRGILARTGSGYRGGGGGGGGSGGSCCGRCVRRCLPSSSRPIWLLLRACIGLVWEVFLHILLTHQTPNTPSPTALATLEAVRTLRAPGESMSLALCMAVAVVGARVFNGLYHLYHPRSLVEYVSAVPVLSALSGLLVSLVWVAALFFSASFVFVSPADRGPQPPHPPPADGTQDPGAIPPRHFLHGRYHHGTGGAGGGGGAGAGAATGQALGQLTGLISGPAFPLYLLAQVAAACAGGCEGLLCAALHYRAALRAVVIAGITSFAACLAFLHVGKDAAGGVTKEVWVLWASILVFQVVRGTLCLVSLRRRLFAQPLVRWSVESGSDSLLHVPDDPDGLEEARRRAARAARRPREGVLDAVARAKARRRQATAKAQRQRAKERAEEAASGNTPTFKSKRRRASRGGGGGGGGGGSGGSGGGGGGGRRSWSVRNLISRGRGTRSRGPSLASSLNGSVGNGVGGEDMELESVATGDEDDEIVDLESGAGTRLAGPGDDVALEDLEEGSGGGSAGSDIFLSSSSSSSSSLSSSGPDSPSKSALRQCEGCGQVRKVRQTDYNGNALGLLCKTCFKSECKWIDKREAADREKRDKAERRKRRQQQQKQVSSTSTKKATASSGGSASAGKLRPTRKEGIGEMEAMFGL